MSLFRPRLFMAHSGLVVATTIGMAAGAGVTATTVIPKRLGPGSSPHLFLAFFVDALNLMKLGKASD
jgi:hypothetical protein